MSRGWGYWFVVGLVALFTASPAVAQRGSIELDPQDVVPMSVAAGRITCGYVNGGWIPGDLRRGNIFWSFKAQIRDNKLKQAQTTDTKRLNRLKRLANTLRTKQRQGNTACRNADQLPTPTPTPTPNPQTGSCYDSQRNTSCFGIPSGVIGNEIRGQTLFQSCAGCHSGSADGGRRNRPYPELTNALATIPQMRPFEGSFTQQDIADIVAYLNRFNPNQ